MRSISRVFIVMLLVFVFGINASAAISYNDSDQNNTQPDFQFSLMGATTYESEPNNTFYTANTINDDDNVWGYISSTSDQDWYSITYATDGLTNFWIGNFSSPCNYSINVYDSNNYLLWSTLDTNKLIDLVKLIV
ncbi:hypothetical protein SDC9_129463 [bioreactor metagenome]|uniref:Uncharacterized protein n=1 Tax=bioreactor metagenome TaxID=1076179 RepID=A0A645D0S1_9ZZZZ